MVNLRPLRIAALALITVASLVLPAHTPTHAAGSAAPAAATATPGSYDFTTTLSGQITDKNHNVIHTVTLNVDRAAGDKTVQLAFNITNGSGRIGSTYTFAVPASDLVIGKSSASLDTQGHLGKYGHVKVQWTYTATATTVTNPPNSCTGMGGTSTKITRLVARATAQLNLTFPCEGIISVTLSGSNLDLDSGQVQAPSTGQSMTQSINYTMVSGMQSKSTSHLVVTGMKVGGLSMLFVSVSGTSTATTGLISTSHFATDDLLPAGLTTSTNAAGKVVGNVQYRGVLGSASFAVTGTGQTMNLSEPARCINPNANKADLSKTVNMSMTQASVTGSVNLMVCSAVKTTFGSSDTGTIMVISTASSSASTPVPGATAPPGTTPPSTSGGLSGAMSLKGFPAITQISPAPGSTISSTPTIVVTFASALPSDAQVAIMLTGDSGTPTVGQAVVSGSTATYTVDSSAPLASGTYKLMVTATSPSAGSMAMYPAPPAQATYTVS